jgi:predicted dehydrogenase
LSIKSKIRIGVVGVGYLGRSHAKIFSDPEFSSRENIELVGVSDTEPARAEEVARQTGSKPFIDYSGLFGKVDAVSIVVPTSHHYKVASDFLNEGVDIFIEKPIASDLKEAEDIVRTARGKDLILQVGHIERFNSGYIVLKELVHRPRFIEAQRLSPFIDRGTDVDVTLDLMIHDIDIVLSLVNSDISEIKALGMPILTPRIDVANARIEFKNGCVANLTASRIYHGKTRRIRIFEEGTYLSLDYQTGEITAHRKISKDGRSTLDISHLRPEKGDPLREELKAFIKSVREGSEPIVSGKAGTEALKVALKVSEIIKGEANI